VNAAENVMVDEGERNSGLLPVGDGVGVDVGGEGLVVCEDDTLIRRDVVGVDVFKAHG
jgi:hypothetical protein